MTLPVEIHFNRRQWRQLRWFLAGMFLVTVPVESMASVRPWPLEVRLTCGRKLKFSLAREEMLEARAVLAQILAAAGRPNLIPDFP